MAEVTMTFHLPDCQPIDVEAFKKRMQELGSIVVAMPSVLKTDATSSSIDGLCGKWQDDSTTAEEWVHEIYENREKHHRPIPEL